VIKLRFIAFILLVAVIFSCKKSETPVIDFGYDYYPVTIGSWISWDVDSIGHQPGNFADTFQYQIKELIESAFIDYAGRQAYRIERFYRNNASENWWLKDVWMVVFTATKAEKVEENVRYVRLVFPVRENQFWDGNALNTQNVWNYSYTSIGNSYAVGSGVFAEAAEVFQEGYNNLIEKQQGTEVYARGIGLVYKSVVDISTQFQYSINPTAPNINGGYELTMTYLDHGQN